MFDSKALGASSQPFLPDSPVRNRRDLSQTAIGPQRQHEQNLNLLRQLRGRWTTMLESEETAKLKQEAATYLSRLAPHEYIQGRELRLLQQMTAGAARPTLSDEGVPVEADPKKALKDLDKKIRSLSARATEGGDPGSLAKVVRAEVQVFGAQQPMKTGTFQGLQTELRAQRDSEAQAETLAQRPEPKTHTVGSPVQGVLSEVAQNRTTLPFEAKEALRRNRETQVDLRKPLVPKAEPRPAHAQVRIPGPNPNPEARRPEPRPEPRKPQVPPQLREPEPRTEQPKTNPELRKLEVQPDLLKPEPRPARPKPGPELRKPEVQPDLRKPEPQPGRLKPSPEVRKPDPQTVQPKPNPEVRKPDPQTVQPKPNPEVRKPDPQTVQPKPHPE
ncbi:hypothetical protein JST97_10725, partial [bacterium]|nr:hypothetical protein [bacterium]